MLNFDFHNLLDWEEFQCLVCDVLNIREKGLKFTTYKRGRDQGTDIRCTNSNLKIIGQIKLWDSHNYNGMLADLKKEVVKCQRLKPNRYILGIGMSLTPDRADEILKMFGGYIQCEEDIIDREKLNRYLNEPEYTQIKESYSKLLVPNLIYVKDVIDNIINRNFYNNTKRVLEFIKDNHSLYYETKQYRQALKKFKKEGIIILTGNPGVGKSTVAQMIIQHMLLEKWDNILVLNGILDIEKVMESDKKQLFFIDDFWGSQFDNQISNRDYLQRFVQIIEDIQRSSNHYLILTSRTYIINSILNRAELEVHDLFELNNYTIALEEYTLKDKAKIFLNHLLFYNCEREYLEYLQYNDLLKSLLSHPNYSPRHVEYFMKHVYNKKVHNCYAFYDEFWQYLKKPYYYLEKILELQSESALLILLLIFISSDPIEIEDLRKTFKRTEKLARSELNMNIKVLEFDEQIKILEELFIVTDQYPYAKEIWLKFRSPGIKDYLLEYLRKKIEYWGEVLIKGAEFFNQLYYVFSTHEEKIDDASADICLFGKKIVLSADLQDILKNKILTEFDNLNFSTGDFSEVADMFTRDHSSYDTEYMKYLLLMNLFNIENNIEVRNFVVERVHKELIAFNGVEKVVSKDSMLRFPYVIKYLKPYLELKPLSILAIYHGSINFAIEYSYFYKFKKIYPKEFEQYYSKYIKNIRKHLRELILEDIEYYYDDEGIGEELDSLFCTFNDLKKQYGIRMNKEFILKMENALGIPGYWKKQKSNKGRYKFCRKKKERERYKSSFSQQMIDTYLGNKYELGIQSEREIGMCCTNKRIKKRLLLEVKKEDAVVGDFVYNTPSLMEMIDFVSATNIDFENISKYTFLDCFVEYVYKKYGIDTKCIKEVLPKLALKCYCEDIHSREYIYYTDIQINKYLVQWGIARFDPNSFYPFLIKEKNWYTFLNFDILLYFVVQALKQEKNEQEYRKTVTSICSNGEQLFWTFIREADSVRFNEKIVKSEMRRFINTLEHNTSHELVLSFLHFFSPTIDLVWEKKEITFKDDGGSNEECIIEDLLCALGIISEFYEWEVNPFFIRDAYYEENIEKYKMRKEGYSDLYHKLLQKFGLLNDKSEPMKGTDKSFNLNIYEFAKEEENYRLLKNVGMEDFILDLYTRIKLKADELFLMT